MVSLNTLLNKGKTEYLTVCFFPNLTRTKYNDIINYERMFYYKVALVILFLLNKPFSQVRLISKKHVIMSPRVEKFRKIYLILQVKFSFLNCKNNLLVLRRRAFFTFRSRDNFK